MESNTFDINAWHFVTQAISDLTPNELWEIFFPKGREFTPPSVYFYEDYKDGFFNLFIVESDREKTVYLFGFLSDFIQRSLSFCGLYNHQQNINNLRTGQEQFYETLLIFNNLCTLRLTFNWWIIFNPYQQPLDALRILTDWWLNCFTGGVPLILGADYSGIVSVFINGLIEDFLRNLAITVPYKISEGELLTVDDFKDLSPELARIFNKCGTEIRVFRNLPSIWVENPIPDGLREFWLTKRPQVSEFLINNYVELGISVLPNRILKELSEKAKNDALTTSLSNNLENVSTNLISLKSSLASLDFIHLHL